jgi:hypothetical protein
MSESLNYHGSAVIRLWHGPDFPFARFLPKNTDLSENVILTSNCRLEQIGNGFYVTLPRDSEFFVSEWYIREILAPGRRTLWRNKAYDERCRIAFEVGLDETASWDSILAAAQQLVDYGDLAPEREAEIHRRAMEGLRNGKRR